MVSTFALISLSSHIGISKKENAPPSLQNVILSEEPQKCCVPASPPESSTDYVDSRNPSTAAGVLDSTLWPSNSKLRNNSPLRDIYSPLHVCLRCALLGTSRPIAINTADFRGRQKHSVLKPPTEEKRHANSVPVNPRSSPGIYRQARLSLLVVP
ncbi:hypothetical protein SprV_0200532800 [Sparganum proliferum]